MKILNLYSGIGGNRELWGNEFQITAVEHNEDIANKYSQLYSKDEVVVTDAHEYLLHNYKEFDFIWSSPPCPTHSRTNYFTQHIRKKPVYPSMKLYQEIIFLKHFYKGKYCVENVKSYYNPLIKPQHIGRHYLWANFVIPKINLPKNDVGNMMHKDSKYSKYWNNKDTKGNLACKKPLEERNKCNALLGLHILNKALGIINHNKREQTKLF
jgi:DNA (cytosine-5)-methyltransferase 1